MQWPSVAMMPAVVALNVNASFLKSTNRLSRLGNVDDVDEAANDSLYPESTEDWTFLLDTSSAHKQRSSTDERTRGEEEVSQRGEVAKDKEREGERERKLLNTNPKRNWERERERKSKVMKRSEREKLIECVSN